MDNDIVSLKEQLAILKAENDALKASKVRKVRELSFKVSQKGALSVYGLNRFPVTLYATQWMKLLACDATIKAFIEANKASLVNDKAIVKVEEAA